MKFFIEIDNRFGGFYTAAYAAAFGCKLAKNGQFRGWVTREQVDELEKARILFKILY